MYLTPRLLTVLPAAVLAAVLAAACAQPAAPASKATATSTAAAATSTATATSTTTTTATASATRTATAIATAAPATSAPAPAGTAAPATQAPAPAAPAAPAAPSSVSTDITGFAFGSPTVGRGGSVTWVNKDATQHDVVGPDGTFRSPTLDESKSYTARFDTAGTFSFYCSIHPFMTGVVTVR